MIIAVLDACVLYPPSLRDLLMWLATFRVFAARWTEEIHGEWIRKVLADNPELTPAQLDRTRRLMNQITPDCVVMGYQSRIGALRLPDENDRHVLAATIESKASFIVTFNLSDFPNAILLAYGTQAVHPDHFFCALFAEDTDLFLRGVKAHRTSLKHPPKTSAEYMSWLKAAQLKRLAAALEPYEDLI